MDRRRFIQITGGITALGIVGVGSVAASGTLTNATVTSSGAIVATDDDFVIAGQDLTVDGSRGSPVIYNDGYSGEIYGNTLTVDDIDDSPTYGILVEGGDVDVYDNTVDAVDDLTKQFIAVGFEGGATGEASRNEITGRHRVGIVARDPETDVDISRNTIVGVGPVSSGWAENGIQVSSGATGTVKHNTVNDHWWNKNNFVSSGIIVFGSDDVTIQNNTLTDNDTNVVLFGDDNNAIHNTIEVTIAPTDPDGNDVLHYGVWVSGADNGVRQSSITASDGDVGIYIFGGSDRTKLIRNDITGWDESIVDTGDDTKLPKPFDPDS